MKTAKEILGDCLQKIFPESSIDTSETKLSVNIDEPRLIGVSVQSLDFDFYDRELASVQVTAENNGHQLLFGEDFAAQVSFSMHEKLLRIADFPIYSLSDLKKVIRQQYC
ncbi:hypothetical protein L3Q72_20930 [Vibrio sp. JC009]|uniref:hypothetical protein n=1 Tax=Vibrio sp. JC009 TaxID=2912314 RepID=UPI0023AF9E13|nr:hypothetical protein [Vibrio sp. JC009]WED23703.1 hypothetical protein L3Q72_20930 [Vibrio sp. JC009]